MKSRVAYQREKKQNFGELSRFRFCADCAQNLPGPAPDIYSECPKFHPNPFTSGRVIAEHVNIVETHHKVFPILGEASSPSKKGVKSECEMCSVRSNGEPQLECNDPSTWR